MSEGYQDQRGIAMPIPTVLGGLIDCECSTSTHRPKGCLSSFRKSSVLLSSTAPKRPALKAHNAHHFGRGKAAGPGLRARLVDSIEKANRC